MTTKDNLDESDSVYDKLQHGHCLLFFPFLREQLTFFRFVLSCALYARTIWCPHELTETLPRSNWPLSESAPNPLFQFAGDWNIKRGLSNRERSKWCWLRAHWIRSLIAGLRTTLKYHNRIKYDWLSKQRKKTAKMYTKPLNLPSSPQLFFSFPFSWNMKLLFEFQFTAALQSRTFRWSMWWKKNISAFLQWSAISCSLWCKPVKWASQFQCSSQLPRGTYKINSLARLMSLITSEQEYPTIAHQTLRETQCVFSDIKQITWPVNKST